MATGESGGERGGDRARASVGHQTACKPFGVLGSRLSCRTWRDWRVDWHPALETSFAN
jgi:hypothetical protein